MSARLATLLQQGPRYESSPRGCRGRSRRNRSHLAQASEADRSALAKEMTRDLGVDTVLLSRVVGSPLHPSDWGRKAEGSRRLYLYLVNRDGRLLWKDELPFMLVKVSSPPLEASLRGRSRAHVMQHVNSLRLDKLGYLPKRNLLVHLCSLLAALPLLRYSLTPFLLRLGACVLYAVARCAGIGSSPGRIRLSMKRLLGDPCLD